MKKNGINHTKRFRLNRKQIIVFSITISMPLIISSIIYYGANIVRSGAQMDTMAMHIHPELSLIMDNESMTVPSNIGIDPSLWRHHSLDEYGMQSMPEMGMSGMAPLHTHGDSGIIHVESSVNRNYTLGEFLKTWGLDVENKTINAILDEKPITDFKNIALKDGEKITLDIRNK